MLGAAAAAAFPARGAGGVWSEGVALPYAVQEIYPALWRGRLVVGGGFRARGPGFVASLGALWPTASVLTKAPDGAAWASLPDFPAQRHHPFLTPFGGRLLAIGGFSSTPTALWQMQAQCWMLSAPGRTWVEGPALPVPQAEVAGGVIGRTLYLAGGRTPWDGRNGAYADHRDTGAAWKLEPGAKQWVAFPPLPTPRNSSASAVLGGRLHVAGGRVVTKDGLRNLAVHEAWDPVRDRWFTLAPMPEARGGHAAAVLNGTLYCFGGESFGADARAHDEVFAYDSAVDRWRLAGRMPRPLHGLGAVAASGAIHLLGGATEAGGRATQAGHLIYRPPA